MTKYVFPLLFATLFFTGNITAQMREAGSFRMRYHQIKKILASKGPSFYSVAMEAVVTDKKMKVTTEPRKGLQVDEIYNLDDKSMTVYAQDGGEFITYKEGMNGTEIFNILGRSVKNAIATLTDEQEEREGRKCKKAIVKFDSHEIEVWYVDSILLRPAGFTNSIFKDIPGLPVVISFKDNRLQMPGLDGIISMYILDSFSVPENAEELLAISNFPKFADNGQQQYMDAYRAMIRKSAPDTTIRKEWKAYFPG